MAAITRLIAAGSIIGSLHCPVFYPVRIHPKNETFDRKSEANARCVSGNERSTYESRMKGRIIRIGLFNVLVIPVLFPVWPANIH